MSVFLSIPEARVLFRGNHFFMINDGFPVSPGHILIVSNELRADFFDLSDAEKAALPSMINMAKEIVETSHKPDGYNIGMNCNHAAGQTVMHFHCHVIPRYTGDADNPRGGVRHCRPGFGYY